MSFRLSSEDRERLDRLAALRRVTPGQLAKRAMLLCMKPGAHLV